MQYSNDPVADAAAYDEWQGEIEQYQASVGEAKVDEYVASCQSFMDACRKADANELVTWAPKTTDWETVRASLHSVGTDMPKRLQTLTEVMQESLDYPSGPNMSEIMQLVLNVAYGRDVVNAPEQARNLLERMANTWARFDVGIEK